MSELRFAQMDWLHAAWGVLALAVVLVLLELRGNSLLTKMLSPLMQSRLVRKPSMMRRLTAIALFCVSLCLLIVAMMRPQWGMIVQTQTRVDSQIMICLDLSKSMLAEDVVPNRLERAKAEIDSLLSLMGDGQQVGLIAFAGKATVLCPMTTDFGFLRLVLGEATPDTVGLGGTRIGEAIQKAVDGFRDAGDVNRLILLITDGEDHDSFPLDAAKAAREKGVRIVSIGFGDEAGSKIEITNSQTGARSYVRDRNGNDVISHLDGETLRDIALETEGAYIPAGTGALDLQSIYDAHIASLLKGTTNAEERVIRNEAYQWCVLAALVFLLVSIATPTAFAAQAAPDGRTVADLAKSTSRAAAIALVAVLGTASWLPIYAQEAQPSEPVEATADSNSSVALTKSESATTPEHSEKEANLSPREVYNQAVLLVSAEPDRAERLLTQARREAGVDGELRFRSLYNLGWVDVARADKLVAAEPEKALQHLEMAAGRFRESIRVRPDSAEARHNLEIVSRRILELTDALAKNDPQDLATRLDEFVTQIRAHQTELQGVVAQMLPQDPIVEQHRSAFRRLGVTERQLISDLEKFTADARKEIAALENDTAQQNGESRLRAAQMSAMLNYVDSGIQRMNKARSFTRRLQGERAFIRWSASLTDAKRARDQLRNPIEVLGVIIGDASELANLTRQMALDSTPQLDHQPPSQKPSWLSAEYLSETQQATTERTAELRSILTAGVQQADSQTSPAGAVDADPDRAAESADPAMNKMLEDIRQALPSIERAEKSFSDAKKDIEQPDFVAAVTMQSEGIAALLEAAEFFFDVRRLIEAMYQDERQVQTVVRELVSSDSLPAATFGSELQAKNVSRSDRLKQMLELELTQVQTAIQDAQNQQAPNSPSAPQPNQQQLDPEQLASQQQRLEFALRILVDATTHMSDVDTQLKSYPDLLTKALAATDKQIELKDERPPSPTRLPADPKNDPSLVIDREPNAIDNTASAGSSLSPEQLPVEQVEFAVKSIEELRRLYFSVIEHLRETAQRQSELNDNTAELSSRPDQQSPEKIGPLESRQSTLQHTSDEIAKALEQQAEQVNTAPPSQSAGTNEQDEAAAKAAADAKSPVEAAALVKDSSQAMQQAAEKLAVKPPSAGEPPTVDFKSLIADQQVAFQKLVEALALLDNRPQDNQDQNQQQQDQQDQQQQNQEQSQQQQQQNMNAAQMLQAIRDREVQRRQEKQPNNAATSGTVEKDW